MQLRQYPLVILATTLLITLTGKSGFAFTITPTPQPGTLRENYSDESIFPRGRGVTTLNSYDLLIPSSWNKPSGLVYELPRSDVFAMVLSHVPLLWTAHNNLEIKRVANMTYA